MSAYKIQVPFGCRGFSQSLLLRHECYPTATGTVVVVVFTEVVVFDVLDVVLEVLDVVWDVLPVVLDVFSEEEEEEEVVEAVVDAVVVVSNALAFSNSAV